jgi:Sulfotransferase family
MALRGRRVGALPNLLVIGAGRCGTTSLHQYLSAHPEIAMSRTKELRFFADVPELASGPPLSDPVERSLVEHRRGSWRRGIDWYRSQFDSSAPVRGEASPIYTHPWFGYCADRIKTVVPDAKLILCVRDPVGRAISHYRHERALGSDPRPVDEAFPPTGLYALTSRYAERLEPYLARFPLDRILIVESGPLESRRREALEEVFRFLGVDDGFWSAEFDKRWNESWRHQGVRRRTIYRLRRLPGWANVASLAPRRSRRLIERLTAPSTPGHAPLPEPSDAVRERLAAALADDAARLRQLTGRAFASWSV